MQRFRAAPTASLTFSQPASEWGMKCQLKAVPLPPRRAGERADSRVGRSSSNAVCGQAVGCWTPRFQE